jgi:hypothetical protein
LADERLEKWRVLQRENLGGYWEYCQIDKIHADLIDLRMSLARLDCIRIYSQPVERLGIGKSPVWADSASLVAPQMHEERRSSTNDPAE